MRTMRTGKKVRSMRKTTLTSGTGTTLATQQPKVLQRALVTKRGSGERRRPCSARSQRRQRPSGPRI